MKTTRGSDIGIYIGIEVSLDWMLTLNNDFLFYVC